MTVQRLDVIAALRAEDVAQHIGLKGQWRGYWMRADRCGEADHTPGSQPFGLKRDGHWHCWACDKGGDLLGLLALSEGLDIKADFPKVLEVAAGLAGIDLDPGSNLFGDGPVKPAPVKRVELPPQKSLAERLVIARKRAAWAWENLTVGSLPAMYLKMRGLDPVLVLARETMRSTPLNLGQLRDKIESRDPSINDDLRTLWYTMGTRPGTLSVVLPVRSVVDGAMVDLRARRVEEQETGRPKIIGMVGGVTSSPAERGKTRQLIGCYGNPHSIDADHVVITEGIMDYLSALQLWPNAQVLGAVEAGTLALVTAHAASALASRDNTSRLTIVEQSDPPRLNKSTGKVMAGAADQSINEDPNAATKVAVRLLRSPRRVGWLFCSHAGDDGVVGSPCAKLGGKPVKDLNDLVMVGANIAAMQTWWADLASTEG